MVHFGLLAKLWFTDIFIYTSVSALPGSEANCTFWTDGQNWINICTTAIEGLITVSSIVHSHFRGVQILMHSNCLL